MATISSIKGDYGRFLIDKVNEKVTSLTKKFIDETITCKHKISCLDRQCISNMSEVKRVSANTVIKPVLIAVLLLLTWKTHLDFH